MTIAAQSSPSAPTADEDTEVRLPTEDLEAAVSLLRELVDSNRESVLLARRLLMAQELATAQSAGVEEELETAARSGGDGVAIERALEVFAAAQRAEQEELALSAQWGAHRQRVAAQTGAAEQMLVRMQRLSVGSRQGAVHVLRRGTRRRGPSPSPRDRRP